MKCKGNFIFKSLEKRNSGEFTNDKGDSVKYDESYQIKVDEVDEFNKINERKFKFSVTNKTLANKFQGFSPYNSIIITFDVTLFSSNVKLVPVDVDLVSTNNK